MPLKQYCCKICGACAPKEYLAHGKSKERIAWLRRHRQKYHPTAFKRSIKKGVKARKKKG